MCAGLTYPDEPVQLLTGLCVRFIFYILSISGSLIDYMCAGLTYPDEPVQSSLVYVFVLYSIFCLFQDL